MAFAIVAEALLAAADLVGEAGATRNGAVEVAKVKLDLLLRVFVGDDEATVELSLLPLLGEEVLDRRFGLEARCRRAEALALLFSVGGGVEALLAEASCC